MSKLITLSMGASHARAFATGASPGDEVDIQTKDRGWQRGAISSFSPDRTLVHVRVGPTSYTLNLNRDAEARCIAPAGSRWPPHGRSVFKRLHSPLRLMPPPPTPHRQLLPPQYYYVPQPQQPAFTVATASSTTTSRLGAPLRLNVSESNIMMRDIVTTPSPIGKRRSGEPVLALWAAVDVLWTFTPGEAPAQWLPARVVELAGNLVRLQVCVPPPGLSLLESLTAYVKSSASAASTDGGQQLGGVAAGKRRHSSGGGGGGREGTVVTSSGGPVVMGVGREGMSVSEEGGGGGETAAPSPQAASITDAGTGLAPVPAASTAGSEDEAGAPTSVPEEPHFEELWLTIEDCKSRLSSPGGKCGVTRL